MLASVTIGIHVRANINIKRGPESKSEDSTSNIFYPEVYPPIRYIKNMGVSSIQPCPSIRPISTPRGYDRHTQG